MNTIIFISLNHLDIISFISVHSQNMFQVS